jgi:UDP:flavonoid glycosyltransferase YjiC (YdhE family)
MSDILFVTWDGGGNVPPALGIARELEARGHTVRFLGHSGQADAVEAAGFEVMPSRRARPFSSQEGHSPFSLIAAFGDRGMGRDLLDTVSARPADLVVIDCMMFGALDAARRAGLRYVVLEHFFDGYYERGCLRGPLGLSLRLRRLAPRRALAGAAGRIVTALPELDPSAGSTPGLTYSGPVVDVAPVAADRAADPMVLVSLSSFAFAGMAASLQHLVDAAARLDAKVVVTTGTTLDAQELRAPAGVEVLGHVPHVELMPHASLLVGHGGHGTSMQALAHDLPVVVMPMDGRTDQPMVGRSIEAAGAGRVVPKKATADDLAPVLAALLADGPHRAAAARLGAAVRALPGATRSADAVEGLLVDLRDGASAPGRPAARP